MENDDMRTVVVLMALTLIISVVNMGISAYQRAETHALVVNNTHQLRAIHTEVSHIANEQQRVRNVEWPQIKERIK